MKVLLVGGSQDGKWLEVEEYSRTYRVMLFDGMQATPEDYHAVLSGERCMIFATHDPEGLSAIEKIAQNYRPSQDLEKRLEDAEITISKIGFCDPTPPEARYRYERKYGSLTDKERKRVEL